MLQKLMFWKKKPKAQLSDQEKAKLQEINTRMADLRSVTFIFFLFLIFVLYSAYFSVFDVEKLGQFGDSFGVLTSFFTGLAFVGLMITIRLQQQANQTQEEELRLNREEMRLSSKALMEQSKTLKFQQLENTFFQLCQNLRHTIKEIQEKNTATSKSNIDVSLEQIKNKLTIKQEPLGFRTGNYHHSISNAITFNDDINEIKQAFEKQLTNTNIGKLIISIANVFNFMEGYEEFFSHSYYTNVVSFQLNASSQAIIFYYLISNTTHLKDCHVLISKWLPISSLDISLVPEEHKKLRSQDK